MHLSFVNSSLPYFASSLCFVTNLVLAYVPKRRAEINCSTRADRRICLKGLERPGILIELPRASFQIPMCSIPLHNKLYAFNAKYMANYFSCSKVMTIGCSGDQIRPESHERSIAGNNSAGRKSPVRGVHGTRV